MSYFGNQKVSFAEAFPEIESMSLKVTVYKGNGEGLDSKVATYTDESLSSGSVRCIGRCKDGEHDLGRMIRNCVFGGGGEIKDGVNGVSPRNLTFSSSMPK